VKLYKPNNPIWSGSSALHAIFFDVMAETSTFLLPQRGQTTVALLVIDEGKYLIEERLAVEAEELVAGHTGLSCDGLIRTF
jgi:hypothetical protein